MWVLFDLDATLVDHHAAFRIGTAALHRASGSVLDPEEFLARWSAAHRRSFDRFLDGELTFDEQRLARVREMFGGDLALGVAERLFSVYITTYEDAWALFPDVLPCLDALAGHRLGVITNGQSFQQRQKLAKLGIAARFEHVTVSDECASPKPDAKIFLRACAACGVEPRDAVYVGDHYEIDAEGARRAGLTGVWLDRARSGQERDGPTIRSLADLPALIERIARARPG